MKKIGIIGYGYLGKAFEVAFKDKCVVYINDIKHEPDGVKFYSKKDIIESGMDLILIGLPTPYSLKKGFDPSVIENVLYELDLFSTNLEKKPIVCIKSAILPSYASDIINRYRSINITVSPEYLSGKDNIRDMVNQEVLIVGGELEACEAIIDLFKNHSICNKNVKTGVCSAVDSALIKYMENAFLAMKCVFMSEFYNLHKKYETGTEFNELLRLWMLDQRMGEYPYKIPFNGELGFCSHCLCKDQMAIRDEAEKLSVNTHLLNSMHYCNEELRANTKSDHSRCRNTAGGVIN